MSRWINSRKRRKEVVRRRTKRARRRKNKYVKSEITRKTMRKKPRGGEG